MKGIKHLPGLALILQQAVVADVSGVMFTNVRRKGHAGILISCSRSPSFVVQGKECETFFIPLEGGGVEPEGPKASTGGRPINSSLLLAVAHVGRQVERVFKKPQDVEWLSAGSSICVVQSRPVTATLTRNVRVWDSSNIAESYSGIVLPLTCSFARHIYKVVYTYVARTSGVAEEKIRDYDEVFENLLGFFYGHFYYNMINWYRMLTLFPGYERNKRNLEHMISAKSKAALEQEHQANVSRWSAIKYYARTFVRYLLFDRELRRFKKEVGSYLDRVESVDFDRMDGHELLERFYEFEQELLRKWSVAVDNDFLCMTFFGMLRTFSQESGIGHDTLIEHLGNVGDVVGKRQVEALRTVAKEFFASDSLRTLASRKKYVECHSLIQTDRSLKCLRELIEDYLSIFGGRFADELRLEAEDLDADPEYLIKLLAGYGLSAPPRSFREGVDPLRISYGRRLVFDYLLIRTKRFLREREELRLLRSKAFSRVRRLFKALGRRLREDRVLQDERDIFYLEVDEIKRHLEGSSTVLALARQVDLRKAEYRSFKGIGPEPVFTTEGNPYLFLRPAEQRPARGRSSFRGEGCSPGIVRGRVTVLDRCRVPEGGTYEIVVARNTDPGWTPVFGLCKGIIVEHGGVLSHAAIVARELRLPCVVGVRDAMTVLKDGQVVTIDGCSGEVQIEP